MAIVTQFGGGSYDTDNYPFVLLKDGKVDGRLSTLAMAKKLRVLTAINNPESMVMLFNDKTKKFIEWSRAELSEVEKNKEFYD